MWVSISGFDCCCIHNSSSQIMEECDGLQMKRQERWSPSAATCCSSGNDRQTNDRKLPATRRLSHHLECADSGTDLPAVCRQRHRLTCCVQTAAQTYLLCADSGTDLPAVCRQRHRLTCSVQTATQTYLQCADSDTDLPAVCRQ